MSTVDWKLYPAEAECWRGAVHLCIPTPVAMPSRELVVS